MNEFFGIPMMGCSCVTGFPIFGSETIMRPKGHGSCSIPAMRKLRFGVNPDKADKICCFNRHGAEAPDFWLSTAFLSEIDVDGETTFHDSVTGKQLFMVPRGRSIQDFISESKSHGWPSFRDEEVDWDNVRSLPNGEMVSVDGTHLGHNLPDCSGNRYCINIVSIAGFPPGTE